MTMLDPDLDGVPDDALLIAYANGDLSAARVLTERLSPRILAYATRTLGDRAEAEDVTQDAMMRLWNIAPDWRQGEAKVSTWVYRVAMNLCIDRMRKTRRQRPLDAAPEPVDEAASPVEMMQSGARVAALQAALAELPDRQAQAVSLRHLQGLPNPQIADIMGQSVEAVESLTARGKRALKAILSGRKDELGFEDD
ncbi:MAG: RNA polymerase sigma factor [Paracoccaceae bacterium]|jgi:RNA polymerase sigma factor (sigma-70 family)|nr:RNA polymerase sigma factor [Paracoccaceae bacterium]MDG1802895.1 RNA polymerase sigma factor [Paracoccaceae bacterium]MDG2453036.1 RNA polymerase sigma factor [Paracoccaceae bacterium]